MFIQIRLSFLNDIEDANQEGEQWVADVVGHRDFREGARESLLEDMETTGSRVETRQQSEDTENLHQGKRAPSLT